MASNVVMNHEQPTIKFGAWSLELKLLPKNLPIMPCSNWWGEEGMFNDGFVLWVRALGTCQYHVPIGGMMRAYLMMGLTYENAHVGVIYLIGVSDIYNKEK